jgi:F0F1-type ATP synthase alpha subunit
MYMSKEKLINVENKQVVQEQINKKKENNNKGKVITVLDDIAIVKGLKGVGMSEMVLFLGTEKEIKGIVQAITKDNNAYIIILGNSREIYVGLNVIPLNTMPVIKGGVSSLGRIVNALGEPIDKGSKLENVSDLPIEKEAPSIIARQSVNEPLETGIKFIDAMVPIGAGQRELIIGDQKNR